MEWLRSTSPTMSATTVADFGIALAVAQAGGGRVTETGFSVGTPHYMSPEQATGDRDVDPRTDVYALGCVLYEMLVGDPPYQGSTAQAVLAKILMDPTPASTRVCVSIPPNVDAAIRKALEKLPADRFTSAQEFSKALGDAGFRHGEEAAAVGVTGGRGQLTPVAIGATGVRLLVADPLDDLYEGSWTPDARGLVYRRGAITTTLNRDLLYSASDPDSTPCRDSGHPGCATT